jgi:hypothetical protein
MTDLKMKSLENWIFFELGKASSRGAPETISSSPTHPPVIISYVVWAFIKPALRRRIGFLLAPIVGRLLEFQEPLSVGYACRG